MSDIAYRYKGPGKYFGIPARDLTADDIAALGPKKARTVRDAAEYTEVKPSKSSKTDTKPDQKEGDR